MCVVGVRVGAREGVGRGVQELLAELLKNRRVGPFEQAVDSKVTRCNALRLTRMHTARTNSLTHFLVDTQNIQRGCLRRLTHALLHARMHTYMHMHMHLHIRTAAAGGGVDLALHMVGFWAGGRETDYNGTQNKAFKDHVT